MVLVWDGSWTARGLLATLPVVSCDIQSAGKWTVVLSQVPNQRRFRFHAPTSRFRFRFASVELHCCDGGASPDLDVASRVLDWFSRTVCGDTPAADIEPRPRPKPRSNTRLPRGGKSPRRNGVHREPHGNGRPRRAKRDADDAALVEAMRVDPAGPLGAWCVAIGKSRTSVVSALHRLKSAGLVANEDRVWSLVVEELELRAPAPAWTKPLRGTDKSAVAHLNAS